MIVKFIRKYIGDIAGFFFQLYFLTIFMSYGTKDYTSLAFYVVILQALANVVILRWIFDRYNKPKKDDNGSEQ